MASFSIARTPAGDRPDGLTRWTIGLLYGLMALAVIAIVSDGFERQLLNEIAAGTYSGPQSVSDAASTSDARQRAIGVIQLIAYIVSVIVIGRWIYKANAGARELGAANMQFTPGWSVGWYFIPITNLFKPFQAMREIWCASANPNNWRTITPPAKLGWWWACWIASNILGQASYRVEQAVGSINGALLSNAITIVADATDFPLCLLLISIVREVAANQSVARRSLQMIVSPA